jgi:hypothetical protein
MTKTAHKFYVGSFLIISIISTALLAIYGFQYYSAPIEERFFLSTHALFKPSGFLGHGIGILGSLMMIFGVAIYMIRKRSKLFIHLGVLKNWLEFHIFLCTLGPIFVLYHTAFKFGGIVAVSFWSMVAVVLSGVIGRFIYIQIPHSISGQELGMDEIDDLLLSLDNKLKEVPTISSEIFNQINSSFNPSVYKKLSFSKGVSFTMKEHFLMKSLLKKLKKELKASGMEKHHIKEILETAKSKIVISRRIGWLRTMQKFFRYWHIIHLPFALVMFVIMLIHIIITFTFGYKWIF